MTENEMANLKPGDLIQSNNTVFIVSQNLGQRVVASRTVEITNPAEWELVKSPEEFWDNYTFKVAAFCGEISKCFPVAVPK